MPLGLQAEGTTDVMYMREYKLFHLRKFLTSESWFVGKLYFLLAFAVGVWSLFYNKFDVYAYNKEQSMC